MNPDVVYAKTAKGHEEITKRTYRLPARVRALLIMIDGRTSASDLIGRAASPEEAASHITGLLDDGFIEAKAVGPSQAAAAGVPPVAVDPLLRTRKFMLDSMGAALGPDAVHFTGKIEAARDIAGLAEIAEKYVEVVRAGGGSKKAEAFRSGLVELGVIQDTGGAPAPARPAPPVEDPDQARRLANAKKVITRFLLATLGPDADRFTGRIESATSTSELKQIAARHLEVIRSVVGSRKAEEFRQQVTDALSS